MFGTVTVDDVVHGHIAGVEDEHANAVTTLANGLATMSIEWHDAIHRPLRLRIIGIERLERTESLSRGTADGCAAHATDLVTTAGQFRENVWRSARLFEIDAALEIFLGAHESEAATRDHLGIDLTRRPR
ncbi:MAG: hypothetical protein ACM3SX_06755 [Deltaproteobacteria bacterium]